MTKGRRKKRTFKCMSFADGRLFFFARLCRGGTGCSGRLMPAGHFLSCATKKESKEVAGNAIPRSRLPSERKIAYSRSSSLYPCFDTNVRNRKYFLNLQLNGRDMLCDLQVAQAGATPGGGLQLRCACCGSAGSGHKLTVRIKTNFRASGRAAASRSGGPVPLGTRARL